MAEKSSISSFFTSLFESSSAAKTSAPPIPELSKDEVHSMCEEVAFLKKYVRELENEILKYERGLFGDIRHALKDESLKNFTIVVDRRSLEFTSFC
jgi:hypothetical protein